MKITYSVGNILSAPQGYYLAHAISSDLSMGAGVAKLLNQTFNLANKIRKWHDIEDIDTGDCITVDNVFNLVDKFGYRDAVRYENLKTCFISLKNTMDALDVTKVAMPKIGCGCDDLDWDRVLELLIEVFDDKPVEFTIYVLHDYDVEEDYETFHFDEEEELDTDSLYDEDEDLDTDEDADDSLSEDENPITTYTIVTGGCVTKVTSDKRMVILNASQIRSFDTGEVIHLIVKPTATSDGDSWEGDYRYVFTVNNSSVFEKLA